MLTELRIKNFAIIETLTLPLARGFNVLSGETGAGKSIIVGALGLLLGERASADLIRTGAERATVEGVFDVGDRPEIRTALDEHRIDVDEETVVLKREIAPGRARAWINGTTVNAGLLAEIGRQLVNLHGQHEAQTLLDAEAQRRILDAFAGATDKAAEVRQSHDELSSIIREIAELTKRRAEAERRADYLRHVVKEVGDAKLADGEDTRLEDEARRLEHAEELRALASGIAAALDGEEESVLPKLSSLSRQLASIQRIDPSLSRLQESYDAAYYSLESLARELEEYESTVELDPARLEDVRRRRDLIFRLTKKYGHPDLSMTVKGQEFPAYDSRGIQGMGLAYATSNRGACHLRGYTVASEVLGIPVKTDPLVAEGKASLVKAFQDATAAFDAAGICIFTSFAWGLSDVQPQVAAACGEEFTLDRLNEIGERIWNMERDFNNKAGFSAKDDTLPKRLLTEPAKSGPAKGLVNKLPEMLPQYYEIRGWDAEGRLKPETRERLGL